MIHWSDNNRVTLLENGEEFFPAALDAIAQAQQEIILETFIFFEDKIGLEFQQALIDAAARGVRVAITVDGYGSPEFSADFVAAMQQHGVIFRAFSPCNRLLGFRTSIFRRLHRKILAVDDRIAFIGGINISDEHLLDFGPMAKQDYAISVEGPLAATIHRFARSLGHWYPKASDTTGRGDGIRAALAVRDNQRHKNDIEREYLAAIRSAKRSIIIANAYFFPATRLLQALRIAADRGVKVSLILQGRPDFPFTRTISKQLYDYLLRSGVDIYEYCERPLHAKVAVVDQQWSTVGSSNLEPLSLWFNLEANVIVDDARFSQLLHDKLAQLQRDNCRKVQPDQLIKQRFWRLPLFSVLFHITRRLPQLIGWLPAHRPRIQPVAAPDETDTPLDAFRQAPQRR